MSLLTVKKPFSDSIDTVSGGNYDYITPADSNYTILDVAWGLSMIIRFGGQITRPYTVAQHSVLVASMVPEELRLDALMHDAPEAFLGDIPSPFKRLLPDYKTFEVQATEEMRTRFGLGDLSHPVIKAADREAYRQERQALREFDKSFEVWGQERAFTTFLDMYERLTTHER